MRDLKEIIGSINNLRPIPQVAHRVMSIIENPKSSISDLSDVIVYDQSLTANILKICNSAYYGLPHKIDSLHQALVYMGMDQLADIVLLSGGAQNFKGKQEGYDLDEGELWKYSVSSALIARDLAERKGSENNHLIFTAALLKDIGKLILSQFVADDYEKIADLVFMEGYSFNRAEREVFGIDHAELGGKVAESWEFSPKMIGIISRHHNPNGESKGHEFETSIVYLADTLCMMMGIGVGADGLAYRFHDHVIKHLGFSQKDIQETMMGFGEKMKEVEELIQIT